MFKRKKHGTPAEPNQPGTPLVKRNPLEEAADRERLRGSKIGKLADEAKMWRAFAAGCKPGRIVAESIPWSTHVDAHAFLSAQMDEITAESWRAFAANMAATAEQRLREILG